MTGAPSIVPSGTWKISFWDTGWLRLFPHLVVPSSEAEDALIWIDAGGCLMVFYGENLGISGLKHGKLRIASMDTHEENQTTEDVQDHPKRFWDRDTFFAWIYVEA